MTLTIEPGDKPKWWVDSSYAVHRNIHDTRKRSHIHIFHEGMVSHFVYY